MLKFIYNLFLPVGFLFFLPGVIWKYRNRGGWKDTFRERFAGFSPKRIEELKAFHGAVWIHAVSVGETVVALSLCSKSITVCTLNGSSSSRPPRPRDRNWRANRNSPIPL